MVDLKEVSKQELIGELETREGVCGFDTTPDVKYIIKDATGIYETGDGPVHVITVVD